MSFNQSGKSDARIAKLKRSQAEPEDDVKSDLSLLMDVVKKEAVTTHVIVKRDKTGKLRYLIDTEQNNTITGVVSDSPTVRNRMRTDSVVRDYIPVVRSLDVRDRSTDNDVSDSVDGVKSGSPEQYSNKSNRKKEKKRKYRERQNRKRLEKLSEHSKEQAHQEVLFGQPSPKPDNETPTPYYSLGSLNQTEPLVKETRSSTKLSPLDSGTESEVLLSSPTVAKQSPVQKQSNAKAKQLRTLKSHYSPINYATKSPEVSLTSKVFSIPPNADSIRSPTLKSLSSLDESNVKSILQKYTSTSGKSLPVKSSFAAIKSIESLPSMSETQSQQYKTAISKLDNFSPSLKKSTSPDSSPIYSTPTKTFKVVEQFIAPSLYKQESEFPEPENYIIGEIEEILPKAEPEILKSPIKSNESSSLMKQTFSDNSSLREVLQNTIKSLPKSATVGDQHLKSQEFVSQFYVTKSFSPSSISLLKVSKSQPHVGTKVSNVSENLVKLQSSLTNFSNQPKIVDEPFETVRVQPSLEKVPRMVSITLNQANTTDVHPPSSVLNQSQPNFTNENEILPLLPELEKFRLLEEPNNLLSNEIVQSSPPPTSLSDPQVQTKPTRIEQISELESHLPESLKPDSNFDTLQEKNVPEPQMNRYEQDSPKQQDVGNQNLVSEVIVKSQFGSVSNPLSQSDLQTEKTDPSPTPSNKEILFSSIKSQSSWTTVSKQSKSLEQSFGKVQVQPIVEKVSLMVSSPPQPSFAKDSEPLSSLPESETLPLDKPNNLSGSEQEIPPTVSQRPKSVDEPFESGREQPSDGKMPQIGSSPPLIQAKTNQAVQSASEHSPPLPEVQPSFTKESEPLPESETPTLDESNNLSDNKVSQFRNTQKTIPTVSQRPKSVDGPFGSGREQPSIEKVSLMVSSPPLNRAKTNQIIQSAPEHSPPLSESQPSFTKESKSESETPIHDEPNNLTDNKVSPSPTTHETPLTVPQRPKSVDEPLGKVQVSPSLEKVSQIGSSPPLNRAKTNQIAQSAPDHSHPLPEPQPSFIKDNEPLPLAEPETPTPDNKVSQSPTIQETPPIVSHQPKSVGKPLDEPNNLSGNKQETPPTVSQRPKSVDEPFESGREQQSVEKVSQIGSSPPLNQSKTNQVHQSASDHSPPLPEPQLSLTKDSEPLPLSKPETPTLDKSNNLSRRHKSVEELLVKVQVPSSLEKVSQIGSSPPLNRAKTNQIVQSAPDHSPPPPEPQPSFTKDSEPELDTPIIDEPNNLSYSKISQSPTIQETPLAVSQAPKSVEEPLGKMQVSPSLEKVSLISSSPPLNQAKTNHVQSAFDHSPPLPEPQPSFDKDNEPLPLSESETPTPDNKVSQSPTIQETPPIVSHQPKSESLDEPNNLSDKKNSPTTQKTPSTVSHRPKSVDKPFDSGLKQQSVEKVSLMAPLTQENPTDVVQPVSALSVSVSIPTRDYFEPQTKLTEKGEPLLFQKLTELILGNETDTGNKVSQSLFTQDEQPVSEPQVQTETTFSKKEQSAKFESHLSESESFKQNSDFDAYQKEKLPTLGKFLSKSPEPSLHSPTEQGLLGSEQDLVKQSDIAKDSVKSPQPPQEFVIQAKETKSTSQTPSNEEILSNLVKLQSSWTALSKRPETVDEPFETVRVQPSVEKVPRMVSVTPLYRANATDVLQPTVPSEPQPRFSEDNEPTLPLLPELEALRLREEPDKVLDKEVSQSSAIPASLPDPHVQTEPTLNKNEPSAENESPSPKSLKSDTNICIPQDKTAPELPPQSVCFEEDLSKQQPLEKQNDVSEEIVKSQFLPLQTLQTQSDSQAPSIGTMSESAKIEQETTLSKSPETFGESFKTVPKQSSLEKVPRTGSLTIKPRFRVKAANVVKSVTVHTKDFGELQPKSKETCKLLSLLPKSLKSRKELIDNKVPQPASIQEALPPPPSSKLQIQSRTISLDAESSPELESSLPEYLQPHATFCTHQEKNMNSIEALLSNASEPSPPPPIRSEHDLLDRQQRMMAQSDSIVEQVRHEVLQHQRSPRGETQPGGGGVSVSGRQSPTAVRTEQSDGLTPQAKIMIAAATVTAVVVAAKMANII